MASIPEPPCASHTRNSLRASRPQGSPSRLRAQQRRQLGRPGLNWVFLAASRNAAGAVLRPAKGFVRLRNRDFLPRRHVSRVKKSVTKASFMKSASPLEDGQPNPASLWLRPFPTPICAVRSYAQSGVLFPHVFKFSLPRFFHFVLTPMSSTAHNCALRKSRSDINLDEKHCAALG